jgi:putative phage-type endonuclease
MATAAQVDLNAPEVRRTGLGASDAAAACGMDRYKSAYRLYLEKTRQVEPDYENDAMRLGKKLQPIILDEFAHRTGKKIEETEVRFNHPDLPWLWATIDGVVNEDEAVEAKSSRFWNREEWGEERTDQVPQEILFQCAQQLFCGGFKVVHVPAFLGGALRLYTVERQNAAGLFERMVEWETGFWNRVLCRKPPDPDWAHKDTLAVMKALYGVNDRAPMVKLGDDIGQHVSAYQALGAQIRDLEADRERAKCVILHAMGEASLGVLPSGTLLTRKAIHHKAYEVKACEYTDLRIKQPKERKQ